MRERSKPPFTKRLDALEVAPHRCGPVVARAGTPQHRVELVLDVLLPQQSPPVDVEVAAGDRRRPLNLASSRMASSVMTGKPILLVSAVPGEGVGRW